MSRACSRLATRHRFAKGLFEAPLLALLAMLGSACATAEMGATEAPDAGSQPDGPPPRQADDERAATAGCYDYQDTDDDGAADCDDPDCGASAICCVGSTSAGCCTEGAQTAIAFAACTPGSLASCDGIRSDFGAPSPSLVGGALVPGGSAGSDSGVVLEHDVEPRMAGITLRARIRAGDECKGCTDAVAFGLTSTQTRFDHTTRRVAADVALVVSGSQREVVLLVGDVPVRSRSFDEISAERGGPVHDDLEYTLSTSPDGTVSATAGGVPVAIGVPFVPAGPAHIVIYGRTDNRGASDPAAGRISRLEVSSQICDLPASVARTGAKILPDDVGGWWPMAPATVRVTSSSTVVYEEAGTTRSRMLFAYEGRVHLAGGLDDGRFRALSNPQDSANALVRAETEDWIAGGVADPELVRGSDRWHIYFTAIARDGSRSIARADGEPGFALQFRSVSRVDRLAPHTEEGGEVVLGYDHPDHAVVEIDGVPRSFLAVRKITATGTSIELYTIEGTSLALSDVYVPDASQSRLERSTSVVRARGGFAFDADEVAGPALIGYRGVLRLYYAGRRGTRWAIGLMLSEDGHYWRRANDGEPIFTGSGSGFDALSVSDPDPVIVNGELRLYYTGSDGVNAAVGLARHAIPQPPRGDGGAP